MGAGRNAQIEVRWWKDGADEMRPIVAEVLAFSPDVIMVFSNFALAMVKPKAASVPVVFVGVGNPIGDGFVTNLASSRRQHHWVCRRGRADRRQVVGRAEFRG
jgi:putative ABC transport system substrate-binding protein